MVYEQFIYVIELQLRVYILTCNSNGENTVEVASKLRYSDNTAYDADFDTVGDDVEIEDDDDVSGFLEFDDRDSSCDETEVEIESIQKAHHMKLQHIKDKLLGTVCTYLYID